MQCHDVSASSHGNLFTKKVNKARPNFCCSECAGYVCVLIRSPRRRIAERFRSAFLLAFKQSMKKILFLFWLVVSVGAFGSGCGTTGKTSHFALFFPATTTTVHATIKIASA